MGLEKERPPRDHQPEARKLVSIALVAIAISSDSGSGRFSIRRNAGAKDP